MLKSDPWGTDGARWHILGWQGGELPALFGIPGRGKGGQNRWGNRLMRARARSCVCGPFPDSKRKLGMTRGAGQLDLGRIQEGNQVSHLPTWVGSGAWG